MNNYIKIYLCLCLILPCATQAGHLEHGIPMTVDGKVELNDVLLTDKQLTYIYTLKNISLANAENAKEDYRFFIEKNACIDNYMQYLLKNDLQLQFIYKVNEQEILSFQVDQNLCTELQQKHWVL